MSFIRNYISYIKDNPDGYWFKRKKYGWGWVPATREGWFVTLLYIAVILFLTFRLDESSTDQEVVRELLIPLSILTALLIFICYKTGEK